MAAFCRFEAGRFDEARRLFQRLIALEPDQAIHWAALGMVCRAQEDLDGAERCFNRAIELDDQDASCWFNRGELHLYRGRLLEAAHDFQRAAELSADDGDGFSQKARLLADALRAAIERVSAAA